MKNVMTIDGAENCAYSVYAIDDEFFAALFPGEGQDIEFIEDFAERNPHWEVEFEQKFEQMWRKELRRSEANGVHGIVFFQLLHKKKYYPNKRESDLKNIRFDPRTRSGWRWVGDGPKPSEDY